MINLFEYQNRAEFRDSEGKLEKFLDEIWKNREKNLFYLEDDSAKKQTQQFIEFTKSGEIKSNKYVGVIYFDKRKINLLPKIFYDNNKEPTAHDILIIQNHILWWLSYCRKIKFPNYMSAPDTLKSDFFEVLIYLFAKYTRELLSHSIYQHYEEQDAELNFIKGRLNISNYINDNLSTGRRHKLSCTYDSFLLDNKFNRIIKYVSKMLHGISMNAENRKYLSEILFVLDEVSDIVPTSQDCLRIRFNPVFEEFETVRDYCYLFLSSSISFDYKNDLKLFAFLLPMEYLFEDFVFGFISKELKDVKVQSQSTSTSLDRDKNFTLRPDMIIETEEKKIIADTKYKIVYSDETDPKKGISSSDLYQMLAYGVRFAIDEIILFYPNTIKGDKVQEGLIIIEDEFADKKEVRVHAYQIPVIDRRMFFEGDGKKRDLRQMFAGTREQLKTRLEEILGVNNGS